VVHDLLEVQGRHGMTGLWAMFKAGEVGSGRGPRQMLAGQGVSIIAGGVFTTLVFGILLWGCGGVGRGLH